MQPVQIGIIGLGNVGSGTLAILAENARDIALKLGFPLRCGRCAAAALPRSQFPPASAPVLNHGLARGGGPSRSGHCRRAGGRHSGGARNHRRCLYARKIGGHRQQGTDGVAGADLGTAPSRPASIWPWKRAWPAVSPFTRCCEKASPVTASRRYAASSTAPVTTSSPKSRPRPCFRSARRSAAGGLCRSRSVRRCGWLRRAIQARDSGGARVWRAYRARRYLHRGHPPRHPRRLRIRAPIGSHYPVGGSGATDSGWSVAVRTSVAGSAIRDPRQRARSLQRRVGAGQIRRGHVLLRSRRGSSSHRSRRR